MLSVVYVEDRLGGQPFKCQKGNSLLANYMLPVRSVFGSSRVRSVKGI